PGGDPVARGDAAGAAAVGDGEGRLPAGRRLPRAGAAGCVGRDARRRHPVGRRRGQPPPRPLPRAGPRDRRGDGAAPDRGDREPRPAGPGRGGAAAARAFAAGPPHRAVPHPGVLGSQAASAAHRPLRRRTPPGDHGPPRPGAGPAQSAARDGGVTDELRACEWEEGGRSGAGVTDELRACEWEEVGRSGAGVTDELRARVRYRRRERTSSIAPPSRSAAPMPIATPSSGWSWNIIPPNAPMPMWYTAQSSPASAANPRNRGRG